MPESPIDFDLAFKALTGHAPFPWQRKLFERLSGGELPSAVDVPTGLGKTWVMAIWLLARAAGGRLPRRLVYVVDRRAVVDQATDSAERLRDALERSDLLPVRNALGLAGRSLPISTLRGQHVDNREWLDDPAGPAIIVGTVDMIGSRLLFEGYGVSRRMRPMQAGLLGCDALVLLDEAHLARPFEELLKAIEKGRRPRVGEHGGSTFGKLAGPRASASLPPPFRVLPLSATLGSTSEPAVHCTIDDDRVTIDDDDRTNETVRRRLEAPKTLTVEDLAEGASLEGALAERAWDLARQEAEAVGRPMRMLIYCDRRTVAEAVAVDLRRRAREAVPGSVVILFVGGRRVHERQLAADELRTRGLMADSDALPGTPVFLVATSAGEVGVDLDADHMVCDLVAWERMVQRLGRVNRLGSGAARVVAIDQGPPEKKAAGEEGIARHSAVRALLAELPRTEGGRQAGPAALVGLAAQRGRITVASTRMPLYPALTRPLVDAWSMTSLAEHTGRPEVDPWLRGWVRDEPRTTVVWRRYLPVCIAGDRVDVLKDKEVEAFFEAAPLHVSERLETETWRVADWLKKRARKLAKQAESGPSGVESDGPAAEADDRIGTVESDGVAPLRLRAPVAFLFDNRGKLDDRGKLNDAWLALQDAAENLKLKELASRIAGRLLVVDARMGGLSDGLLNAEAKEPVTTIECPEAWDEVSGSEDEAAGLPSVRVRLSRDDERNRRLVESIGTDHDADPNAEPWRDLWATPYRVSESDRPVTWLVVEQWRGGTSGEEGKSLTRSSQALDTHQEWAAKEAARIARDLDLDEADRTMLESAARVHDEGKRASRWQRAFNAPRNGGPYAKTRGPFNRHVLNGYRHEFQSMLDIEKNGLDGLDRSGPRFDLALHLLAAHHGHARPDMATDGCDGLPPSAAEIRAYEVGRRFVRLQRQWGPWGLAWWEALLRAADQRASRAFDESSRAKSRATKTSVAGGSSASTATTGSTSVGKTTKTSVAGGSSDSSESQRSLFATSTGTAK